MRTYILFTNGRKEVAEHIREEILGGVKKNYYLTKNDYYMVVEFANGNVQWFRYGKRFVSLSYDGSKALLKENFFYADDVACVIVDNRNRISYSLNGKHATTLLPPGYDIDDPTLKEDIERWILMDAYDRGFFKDMKFAKLTKDDVKNDIK